MRPDLTDDELDRLLDAAEFPEPDVETLARRWDAATAPRGWGRGGVLAAAAVLLVGVGVSVAVLSLPKQQPDVTAAVVPPRTAPSFGPRRATEAEARAFLARLIERRDTTPTPAPAPASTPPADHAAEAARLVALDGPALWAARGEIASADPAVWSTLTRYLDAPRVDDRRAAAVLLSGTGEPAVFVAMTRRALAGPDDAALRTLALADHPVAAGLLAQLAAHPRTAPAVAHVRRQIEQEPRQDPVSEGDPHVHA